MPRNSEGTYTLPTGNPVATGTVVSASWANNTLGDIANEITQSLDRNGRGGMNVPFQNGDGTVGAPGISWADETDSGVYMAASNDMRASVNGVDVARYITDPAAAGSQVPFEIWDGSAFVKPVIGAGESPDFTDVTVQGNVTAGDTLGFGLNGSTPTMNVASITKGFGIAYGHYNGGGFVFPSTYGVEISNTRNASDVDVTFYKDIRGMPSSGTQGNPMVWVTGYSINPVSSYHNIRAQVINNADYGNSRTITVRSFDSTTGVRAGFSIVALVV